MARYKLTLAYDGSGFAGSQRQAATQKRTVQGELEKALRTLGWEGRAVIVSGRTDTGVHATGQVASADLHWPHPEGDLVRALNAALPGDVAVWSVQVVDDAFHPRFDATSRRYRYRLFCQPIRDPLRERFAWRVQPVVHTAGLAEAAMQLLGTHDFSAFGSPTTPRGTTVRTVMQARWTQTAVDAFLYRMVRRMVFIQVAVAQGKLSAEAIAFAFAGQADGKLRSGFPSGLAPAQGLTLVEVTYQESMKA
jgi:tRNA pseudouridine38-40 synthase